MKTPLQIEIIAKNTIEITTEEYADLLASRTRLDIVCDLLAAPTPPTKEILLIVARSAPLVIKPLKEVIEPSEKEAPSPEKDDDLPEWLQ